jgi:hypothetical protein
MEKLKMLSFDVHKTMLNVKSVKKIKCLQLDQEPAPLRENTSINKTIRTDNICSFSPI